MSQMNEDLNAEGVMVDENGWMVDENGWVIIKFTNNSRKAFTISLEDIGRYLHPYNICNMWDEACGKDVVKEACAPDCVAPYPEMETSDVIEENAASVEI